MPKTEAPTNIESRFLPRIVALRLGESAALRSQTDEFGVPTSLSIEDKWPAFFPTIQLTGQALQQCALRRLFGPGASLFPRCLASAPAYLRWLKLLGHFDLQERVARKLMQYYRQGGLSSFPTSRRRWWQVEQLTRQEQFSSGCGWRNRRRRSTSPQSGCSLDHRSPLRCSPRSRRCSRTGHVAQLRFRGLMPSSSFFRRSAAAGQRILALQKLKAAQQYAPMPAGIHLESLECKDLR